MDHTWDRGDTGLSGASARTLTKGEGGSARTPSVFKQKPNVPRSSNALAHAAAYGIKCFAKHDVK